MTPLKQQISLIPYSIEHTGIALTSDGVLKIGDIRRSVFCYLAIQLPSSISLGDMEGS